ncbi:MAG TPA: glycosyltransferase [Solirubrobacteraceae bacterium]|nr:glycosyltransferase [Solirubrobacteraceae bacterium]
MRILIFHGYLLGGTGSNVYNARLAAALVRQGHEVHLLCQDRHPERQPFVNAAGDWDAGALQMHELRSAGEDTSTLRSANEGNCTVYRPDIGALLPVYVADRYEGIEARTFAECSEAEVETYLRANVAAVREVSERVSPQLALANHLVMGPVILARALDAEVPYAVKIHGSALEYTVKPEPERFLPYAREGLAGAGGILVGSHHTAASLWRALEDPEVERRTRLGPPGVDIERFAPRDPEAAARAVMALAERLGRSSEPDAPAPGAGPGGSAQTDAFARDERAAGEALARLDPADDRLVAFVGKLIVSKGVDLLIAAWPLVLERVPQAKLIVIGFGAYRTGLERLRDALRTGDFDAARAIAIAGRSLELEPSEVVLEGPSATSRPLGHLLAFLDSLRGDARERYLIAASALGEQVVMTGRLEHEELVELLPACEALVVPSTFPEAFGMVAAEAAACGVLPVSAGHSGLAEVSAALAQAVPRSVADLLSFPVNDHAVDAIAERVGAWLTMDPALKTRAHQGLVETVRERWSWDGVARVVIAAAEGRLDGLSMP